MKKLKVSSTGKNPYLFLLNKNPLLEKSDPELKRGGGLLTRDFLILKIWLFAQELTKKGQKISRGFAADFS